MPDALRELGAVDLCALVLIAFQAVLGLVRGFVWQLTRLVTIVVGIVLARTVTDSVAEWMNRHFSITPPADRWIAYFVIFAGTFAAGTLLAHLLRSVLSRLRLQSYDRLLGVVLGAVKAAAIIVVAVLLLSQLKGLAALQAALARSHSARLTVEIVEFVAPAFPAEIREDFASWWEEFREKLPASSTK